MTYNVFSGTLNPTQSINPSCYCRPVLDTMAVGLLLLIYYNRGMHHFSGHFSSLPSNKHHRSNDDCLEGKRENYQVCCVQYSVQQLCTVQCNI